MDKEDKDDGCWVEAEEWLNHYYPEHDWCMYHRKNTIIIARYTNGMNYKSAQVPQKIFREWVRKFDFSFAMRHLLLVSNFVHFTDTMSQYRE